MEIPEDLKTLYKHWSRHTEIRESAPIKGLDNKLYKEILHFANERMSVYERKTSGEAPPYSLDVILNKYRFCNIYRELDRQTIFFHKLLKPHTDNFALWLLNMMFCRFICSTETVSKVGLLNFDMKNNQDVFEKLSTLPSPKYGVAYIFPISAIQRSKYNTREKFFCYYLPTVAKGLAKEIETFKDISVCDALERILPIFKFNFKFHFTEILIDIAYQYPERIDLFKKFPIGPGSKPTMKRLNDSVALEDVCLNLVSSYPKEFNYLTIGGKKIFLSAENWEGIGCEFRKYTNLSKGLGRKRVYKIVS